MAMGKGQRSEKWLFLCLFAGIAAAAGYRHGSTIPLMGDELVTYYIGTLETPRAVLAALTSGADSQGPLFQLANWLWLKIGNCLGEREIEIWQRFPSIIAWALTLWFLQRAFRSVVSPWLAAAAALAVLAWPESLLHLAENRAYAMLMLVVAVSLYLGTRIMKNGESRGVLIAIAATQAAGILCHLMSGIFGAAGLGALLIAARQEKRTWLWKTGLASIVGWLALAPWLAVLVGQMGAVLEPGVKWAMAPDAHLFFLFLAPGWWNIGLGAAAGVAISLPAPRRKIEEAEENQGTIRFLILTGVVFFLAASALWLASQKTNPLFLERYVLPMRIGWAATLTGLIAFWKTPKGYQRIIGAAACLGLGISIVLSSPQPRMVTGGFWSPNPWVDAGGADAKFFREPIPIACETSTTYLPRHFYFGGNRPYYLVLDEAAAKADGGAAAMDYAMNRGLESVIASQHIKTATEFGRTFSDFYLLDETNSSTAARAFPPEEFFRIEIPLGPKSNQRNIQLYRMKRVQK